MHPAKLCALAAAMALVSATAAYAAATQVNITDPNTQNRAAHVDKGGRLAVQEVPPASFFHQGGFLNGANSCVTFGTAPANKAVVVRQIRIDVTDIGTSAPRTITFFLGSFCNEVVGQATPGAVGPLTVTFEPGLVLNPGAAIAASGSPQAALFVDGYTIDPSVP